MSVIQLTVRGYPLSVWDCDNQAECNRGLLGLVISDNQGFVLPSGPAGLHTNGMSMPIDILWLDKNGKTLATDANVPPNMVISKKGDYALELRGGWLSRHPRQVTAGGCNCGCRDVTYGMTTPHGPITQLVGRGRSRAMQRRSVSRNTAMVPAQNFQTPAPQQGGQIPAYQSAPLQGGSSFQGPGSGSFIPAYQHGEFSQAGIPAYQHAEGAHASSIPAYQHAEGAHASSIPAYQHGEGPHAAADAHAQYIPAYQHQYIGAHGGGGGGGGGGGAGHGAGPGAGGHGGGGPGHGAPHGWHGGHGGHGHGHGHGHHHDHDRFPFGFWGWGGGWGWPWWNWYTCDPRDPDCPNYDPTIDWSWTYAYDDDAA
jgi:uncharacterized membrane protein (UPF0127 family)